MPRNYFITGEPKAGKTTLIRDLVKELKKKGFRVGGFVSPEERHHGTRMAFRVMDVDTGKSAMLASVKGDGPKISKYHVDIKSFESIALPAMEKSGSYDVMVIDEIGLMELKSRKFANMLDELLESETPLIAALHADMVGKYSAEGEVLELDTRNRGQVYGRLLGETEESVVKKPLRAEKKAAPKVAPQKKPGRKAGPKPEKKAGKKAEKPAKKKQAPKERPPVKKVEMEEVALQEEPSEKEKKPEEKGGLIDRIKRLFGS